MTTPLGDDSGANILLEYIYTLIVTMVLFSIIVLLIANMRSVSDSIALKEELDIVANDVADRLSAFTCNAYMNSQPDVNSTAIIQGQGVYFDLPELVEGKQYNVNITYSDSQKVGTVVVSYVSNTNVYSTATFKAMEPVKNVSFNSQDGRYGIYYYTLADGSPIVEMRSGA